MPLVRALHFLSIIIHDHIEKQDPSTNMHPPLAQTGGKSLVRFRVFDSVPLPLILRIFIIWQFSLSPFNYFFFFHPNGPAT